MTLIHYSTIGGHLPALVSANNAQPRRKQVNKFEAAPVEPPKEEVQTHVVSEGKVLGHVLSPDLMYRSKPLWMCMTVPAPVPASETEVAAPCVRLIGHLDSLCTLASRLQCLSWPTHKGPGRTEHHGGTKVNYF